MIKGDAEVHSAGYVNDLEHCGKGINDFAIIMRELGLGTQVLASHELN